MDLHLTSAECFTLAISMVVTFFMTIATSTEFLKWYWLLIPYPGASFLILFGRFLRLEF